MTDLDKIRFYYSNFDEWGRLDTFPGQLELKIVVELIGKYLSPPAGIFDLGGGAGRYTHELAKKGFSMHLADLSPDLIRLAKHKLEGLDQVKSIQVMNAVDLSEIGDEFHSNILLFGPLYHLTVKADIQGCLSECYRVLKPKGKIFVSFIPYQCGLISILERSLFKPDQVDAKELAGVADTGIFNNLSTSGFQEGNYLKTSDLQAYFSKAGFQELELRSIRGIAYQKEKAVLGLERERPEYFKAVMEILHQTAADSSIIDTCGHAIYIGEKQ